jgi:hypothetical protein
LLPTQMSSEQYERVGVMGACAAEILNQRAVWCRRTAEQAWVLGLQTDGSTDG